VWDVCITTTFRRETSLKGWTKQPLKKVGPNLIYTCRENLKKKYYPKLKEGSKGNLGSLLRRGLMGK